MPLLYSCPSLTDPQLYPQLFHLAMAHKHTSNSFTYLERPLSITWVPPSGKVLRGTGGGTDEEEVATSAEEDDDE